MTSLATHTANPRLRHSAVGVDLLVAAVCMVFIGAITMLTPAFSDFEAEIEPALDAIITGQFHTGLTRLPVYGASVLIEAPFAWLGHELGGDLWMYRLAALPGAFLMAGIAAIAAQGLRAAERPRVEQLGCVVLIAASPCLSRAWTAGHHEEILVAGLASVGMLLLAAADDSTSRLQLAVGGAVLGMACGGKLWPLLLLPVALATTRRPADALLVAGSVLGVTAIMVAPIAIAQLTTFRAGVGGLGDQIFSAGNAWWFFGARNPNWIDPGSTEGAKIVVEASYRLRPGIVAYAHELMLGLSVLLSAAWWRRNRGSVGAERTASVLFLAASVVWWRGLLDPWFQPYYLAAALVLWTLADARRGKFPVTAGIAWLALWLMYGPSSLTAHWSADAQSALALVLLLPVGVWSTVRALRSAE